MNKRVTGSEKERIAHQFLCKKGVRIVACNFRIRQGEIDLIGYDGRTLVFFEVKYRKNAICGSSSEAVGIGALSAANMTPRAFATIALLMSICIMWGMVLSIFFNKGYLAKIQRKGSGKKKDSGFGDLAMTAMFIGLVSAYIGSYIGKFVSEKGILTFSGSATPLLVSLVSAAVMAVFTWLIEKKRMVWLESFSIAGSMLIGMLAAILM